MIKKLAKKLLVDEKKRCFVECIFYIDGVEKTILIWRGSILLHVTMVAVSPISILRSSIPDVKWFESK